MVKLDVNHPRIDLADYLIFPYRPVLHQVLVVFFPAVMINVNREPSADIAFHVKKKLLFRNEARTEDLRCRFVFIVAFIFIISEHRIPVAEIEFHRTIGKDVNVIIPLAVQHHPLSLFKGTVVRIKNMPVPVAAVVIN